MKHVYVFDMDNDFVKIGIAVDVERRMSGVSHSSGFAILRHYETGTMPESDARELERNLHNYFKAYRERGEFFKISFEEACAELNARKPAESVAPAKKLDLEKRISTPQKKIADTISLFLKKFCTRDENDPGACAGGILVNSFNEEFRKWFNANSRDFTCELGGLWAMKFYSRATGEEVTSGFKTSTIWSRATDGFSYRAGKFSPDYRSYGGNEWIYFRIYWKQGSPQELALRQRVQRVRDAFTGLDQQAQDSIIGGFVTDFINSLSLDRDILLDEGLGFGKFFTGIEVYIEQRLRLLCGEYFRVHLDTHEELPPCSRYRGITARPETYELDDSKIGVYHSDFLQLIQRYCPLECFWDGGWLNIRRSG